MSASEIRIVPLTGKIGAEIVGVDLAQRLDAATEDAIYRALLDHLVIFFRDQEIPPERHLAFAQSFGDLDVPHPLYEHVPGFDRIVKFANDAKNPPDTDNWHTDLTFRPNPPMASILVAREVPETGGDTLWANMYTAYDALPVEMKAQIEPLSAVHDMGDFKNFFTAGETTGDRLLAATQRFGFAIHKVVQIHPITGKKYLYVNDSFTAHVIGQTARASRRLLNYLLDHISRPEHQVRFRWRAGSVAMWDNRCTQHYAVADYLPAYRCMNRITVVNDRRVKELSSASALSRAT
jgi:taurine dioxygenase